MNKTEIFINKIISKNNPNHFNKDGSLRYSYDKTIYVHSKNKIIISCKYHGDFDQIPNSHLSGNGCPNCKNSLNIESFIEKSNQKHDNKYIYDKVIYTGSQNKVIITCSTHGDFEQLPDRHLAGTGCIKCEGSFNTESFIEKANRIHNHYYKYNTTVYVNSVSKVFITCLKHGDFEQSAASHLAGNGCIKCGGEKISKSKSYSKANFTAKANIVHKDKYSYTESVYKGSQTKVIIGCPIHGSFTQKPDSHLNGAGCPKCAYLTNGWTKTNFKDKCDKNNNGLGIFYIIRCYNESESFYKIGITSRGINKRFSKKGKIPYKYEIIHEVHRDSESVYNLEKKLLRNLANHSYQPLIPFNGQTECISSLKPFYELFRAKLTA